MDKVRAVVRKLDGRGFDMVADAWGLEIAIKGHGTDEIVGIDLTPSDAKYLHDCLGKALANWDQSEL